MRRVFWINNFKQKHRRLSVKVALNFSQSSPWSPHKFHFFISTSLAGISPWLYIIFSRTHSNNIQLFDRYECCMMERHIFLPYFLSFFNRIKFPSHHLLSCCMIGVSYVLYWWRNFFLLFFMWGKIVMKIISRRECQLHETTIKCW